METIENTENLLIGAILLDNREYYTVSQIVDSRMLLKNKDLFELIAFMVQNGEEVTINTLYFSSKQKNIPVSLTELVDWQEYALTSTHAKFYAEKVYNSYLENQARRFVHVEGRNIINDKSLSGVEKIIALQEATAALEATEKGKGYLTPSELTKSLVDALGASQGNFTKTGFKKLDELLVGYREGGLITVACRPFIGKTAFVIASMVGIGRAYNYTVPLAFFSMEQTSVEISERFVSQMSHTPIAKIIAKEKLLISYEGFNTTLNDLYNSNFYISEQTGLTLEQLKLLILKLKNEKGIKIVFIDHLGFIKPARGTENKPRTYQVEDTVSGLKDIAKKLSISIVLLVQTSRESERKEEKTPLLSDLSDSKSIEAYSDVVLFIDRPEIRDGDGNFTNLPYENCHFIIAKNRNGSRGKVDLYFVSQYVAFCEELPDGLTRQEPNLKGKKGELIDELNDMF